MSTASIIKRTIYRFCSIVLPTFIYIAAVPAKAYTALAKIDSVSSTQLVILTREKLKYILKIDIIKCDYNFPNALKKGSEVLFYRDTKSSIGIEDPMVFDSLSFLSDQPSLFLLSTGTGIGASNGKCPLDAGELQNEDEQGCCSSHQGVRGCWGIYVQCLDGSISPTCKCKAP